MDPVQGSDDSRADHLVRAAYTRVYGTRLIEIEYTDRPRSAYTRACTARSGRASILLRDRDVVRAGTPGYLYRHC